MKQYVKPTVELVELSVKENIAALPVAIGGATRVGSTNVAGNESVTLTTYNLTVSSSDV